ncbi:hypothetical protein [Streptacidiphilus cavernicola]|uniref:Uncharacterized protein n=1 Tax=Streptacidiphilus cavernicola TaxID=3342716 RepID=A0ABV6VP51_9ACTN
MTTNAGTVRIGARPEAEVRQAQAELEAAAARPRRQTALTRGALAGYAWATGRAGAAPVTGAVSTGPPDLADLTAEIDASVVQLAQQAQRRAPRDYVRGVHDALSWVCAHTDDRP